LIISAGNPDKADYEIAFSLIPTDQLQGLRRWHSGRPSLTSFDGNSAKDTSMNAIFLNKFRVSEKQSGMV
jgi:hypothetical protein